MCLHLRMNTYRAIEMLHVLIIDDDEDDREIFCEIVKEVDCLITCLACNSAEQAFNTLRSLTYPRPDIIFLDLNMPKINGMQFLTELKSDELLKSIPVIIYSTGCSYSEVRRALQLGAINYVIKPCTYKKTVKAIRFFLNAYLVSTKKDES